MDKQKYLAKQIHEYDQIESCLKSCLRDLEESMQQDDFINLSEDFLRVAELLQESGRRLQDTAFILKGIKNHFEKE